MNTKKNVYARWSDPFVSRFLRLAAKGLAPASCFTRPIPAKLSSKTGKLHLEIVSHCWNYAHFFIYQLSSIVLSPPTHIKVTFTLFYCEDDADTTALTHYFSALNIPNVTWNWQALSRENLFRRSIGRNRAAKNSQADWIWFTDCDLMFREQSLDKLNELLQGKNDVLLFPRQERITPLLIDDDPRLRFNKDSIDIKDIDTKDFTVSERGRATGPLQITHGDVARELGYCEDLAYYQRPSLVWCKAYEDRAFRWLLRSQGKALDLPGIYRIRHIFKGRYTGGETNTLLRKMVRKYIANKNKS